MLLTAAYRDLNQQLHNERPDYGCSAKQWIGMVREIASTVEPKKILDYGCGKRKLAEALSAEYEITSYDPCIEGFDTRPYPHDMVCCIDVLEHIEPECLDDVLDDLARLSRKLCFMTVATGPAGKQLPDGRNTHLIQKPYEWWLPKIWSRFRINQFNHLGGHFIVWASPPL